MTVLAQRGYFKDPAFVNYIKYLQYWKEPAYAKYLKYIKFKMVIPEIYYISCLFKVSHVFAFLGPASV